MPELIALLHSFVGIAAVLIGWNGALGGFHGEGIDLSDVRTLTNVHEAEIAIGIFIGAVTFTGSIVANLKLSARMKSSPLMLPGKNFINVGALLLFAVLTVLYVCTDGHTGARPWILLAAITILALLLGWHLVASIGGGDMPVVVSMLNSYSGWAAAASGFLLGNDLLIVTGALVGSSGAILSYIMCRAMNRSFLSVIAGRGGDGMAGAAGAVGATGGRGSDGSGRSGAGRLFPAHRHWGGPAAEIEAGLGLGSHDDHWHVGQARDDVFQQRPAGQMHSGFVAAHPPARPAGQDHGGPVQPAGHRGARAPRRGTLCHPPSLGR